MKILVANGGGFGAGEFVTVHCTVAGGKNPAASDFTMTGFSASGFDTLTSSNVDLTGQLTVTALQ